MQPSHGRTKGHPEIDCKALPLTEGSELPVIDWRALPLTEGSELPVIECKALPLTENKTFPLTGRKRFHGALNR